MNRNYIIASIFLALMGAWATGLIDRLIAGDTTTYLKILGGYGALALGSWLMKRGVWDNE